MKPIRSPPVIKETPSTNPELLDVWEDLYNELTNFRPKWRALRIIGDRYGVSVHTVEYHLFPDRKVKQRRNYASQQQSYKKQNQEKINAYAVMYMAAIRHIDVLLEKAFEKSNNKPMGLSDLVLQLHDVSGIMFRPPTIICLSNRFEVKKGYPLLVEVPGYETPHYRLSK